MSFVVALDSINIILTLELKPEFHRHPLKAQLFHAQTLPLGQGTWRAAHSKDLCHPPTETSAARARSPGATGMCQSWLLTQELTPWSMQRARGRKTRPTNPARPLTSRGSGWDGANTNSQGFHQPQLQGLHTNPAQSTAGWSTQPQGMDTPVLRRLGTGPQPSPRLSRDVLDSLPLAYFTNPPVCLNLRVPTPLTEPAPVATFSPGSRGPTRQEGYGSLGSSSVSSSAAFMASTPTTTLLSPEGTAAPSARQCRAVLVHPSARQCHGGQAQPCGRGCSQMPLTAITGTCA